MGHSKPTTCETGREGEIAAVGYLEKVGFKILARNYRCRNAEIDIVAYDARTDVVPALVCIEVKYWKHTTFPLDDIRFAVDTRKLQHMRIGFSNYIALHPGLEYDGLRMDVICVTGSSIHHFEGVG